jgi:hypothetical protein
VSMNHSSFFFLDPLYVFRVPDTRINNIRRIRIILIEITGPFYVLSIGSILTSHTLIFQRYPNKKIHGRTTRMSRNVELKVERPLFGWKNYDFIVLVSRNLIR